MKSENRGGSRVKRSGLAIKTFDHCHRLKYGHIVVATPCQGYCVNSHNSHVSNFPIGIMSNVCYYHSVMFTRLSSSSERWICYCSLMILVGAWLGAFPILLDWNRPWQVSD